MGVLDAENNPIFADMENESPSNESNSTISKKIWVSKTIFFKNHLWKNLSPKHSILKTTKKISNRSKVLPTSQSPLCSDLEWSLELSLVVLLSSH